MEFKNKDTTAIERICLSIDKNIEQVKDRGLLAQNIVKNLRHLVEAVCVFIYNYEKDTDLPVEFSDGSIQTAMDYIASKGNYKFLREFHDGVQVSVSHYVPSEDEAIRLMGKYHYQLVMLKKILEERFGIVVLERIYDYPINMDSTYHDYYARIIPVINACDGQHGYWADGRYYVQKIKPIIWNKYIYYEITLCPANDKNSKFDRIIVFSRKYISTNYSIKVELFYVQTMIYKKRIIINVMTDYSISIRPCEINNLGKVFGFSYRISGKYNEYKALMSFLTEKRINLLDICTLEDEEIQNGYLRLDLNYLRTLLDSARRLIDRNKKGSNVIRYLLYTMRNRVIKDQLSDLPCQQLSDLYLNIRCDRFDSIPYTMNLCNHKPALDDLYRCIDPSARHDELLARRLISNSENEGEIYTSVFGITLDEDDDLEQLIISYNNKQYYKHPGNHIVLEHSQLFIREYEEDCLAIVNKLDNLAEEGIHWYESCADQWLSDNEPDISDDKKAIIRKMFADSKVALLYGAAGTGKTTVIKTVADLLYDERIMFLTTTNTAKNNLERMIGKNRFEFKTIANYQKNKYKQYYDTIIIDECSTTSNSDVRGILSQSNYEKVLLVGDTYQLESIDLGNWFMLARSLMDKDVCYELESVHRTKNPKLLKLWELVRTESRKVTDYMSKNNFNFSIGEEIMNSYSDDEIILCLNYDGVFGINNINSILQSKNQGKEVYFGINPYKVGDPVVFNESKVFGDVLYNNLKAVITDVKDRDETVYFEVMVETMLDSSEVEAVGARYIGENDNRSIIGFSIKKIADTDEDDRNEMVVPFNVAYAMSIYKAQGLEYKSVKVVIPNDLDELVTSNVFYTAITRAKESLKIYWSPETQQRIIEKLHFTPSNKVLSILKNKLKSM